MEESKLKKVIDKILIGIFTILCFCAFFMVVEDLPYSISAIIGYEEYDGGWEMTSFFVCCALLGYVMKYYEDKKHDEHSNLISEHTKELVGLNNIWKIKDYYTSNITVMDITRTYEVSMILNDEYSVVLPVGLFHNIRNEKDLERLDVFISTLLKEDNADDNDSEEVNLAKMKIFEMQLKEKIEEYLRNYKSKEN